jgi:hypothetical protein
MAAQLAAAERMDGYRQRCGNSKCNAAARSGDEYEPFFVDKSTAEYMEDVAATTPLLHRAEIVVMKASADNGYPHTRPGNIICMPSGACNKLPSCRTTLIHEAIHLHQREFIGDWISFLINEGWTQQFRTPAQLVDRARINPDTMACPFWSWQDHYQPLPLFPDKPQLRLGDADIKWLDLRMNAFTSPPPSFVKRWNNSPQPEHPFELYAVEMAETCRTDDDIFNIMAK